MGVLVGNAIMDFETRSADFCDTDFDDQVITQEGLLTEYDGCICHDEAFAAEIELCLSDGSQEANPCLVGECQYFVVAEMAPVVQV